MKYKLRTEGHFDSAHKLIGYEGKCSQLHGHRWRVVIEVEGVELDKDGILWDFTNLKKILDEFDHKDLNSMPMFEKINPTAENISRMILARLVGTHPWLGFKVRVYESPKSYCEVETVEDK